MLRSAVLTWSAVERAVSPTASLKSLSCEKEL